MKKILTLLLGIILLTGCTKDDKAEVVPTPPENLTGEVISATAINLMWTDRSTNENGFKIERKLEGGTFEVIGTTATNIATFSDTGLTPSTNYIYRVNSYNEGGNSPAYSNEVLLTTNSSMLTNNNPYLPNYNFSVDINMNLPAYSNLLTPINAIYYPNQGTGRGLFIFNTGSGYNVFDAACPNQALSSCSTMSFKKLDPVDPLKIDKTTVVCSCDGAEYSLFSGQSTGKQYSMKQYLVEVSGYVIRVYN